MTKTEIANIALAKFREGRITNIESTTDQVAVVMNDQYDHALELVLEEHRWNFAGKRVTLTQLSDDPPFGWDHQYALPSDLIRLKDVNGEDVEASSRLFALEGNALLTNDDTVTITYVARITDTSLFSPSFIEALTFKLASITCGRLTGDTDLAIVLDKQYNYALSKAIHNDTKASGSRDRNLMQRMLDSSPLLGGSYRYPSSGSSSSGSASGTVAAHKHELSDLLQSGATNGQHIVWNDTDGVWEAADVTAGGVSPLTTKGDIFTYDTDDARLPVGSDGQFLKADSTQPTGLKWETASGTGDLLAANNLSELTPTASTARSNLGLGTAATSNTGDFAAASHTHAATDITSGTLVEARIPTHTGDVTGGTALTVDKTAISGKALVTAAAGDHILVGDASDTDNLKKVTAQSIADLGGGGASQLSDLSDVVSATNTDKFVLVANGTTGYVGRALLEADISNLQAYITGITGEPLSDLSDVTITSIASGEILRWNGSAWINQTHAEAGLPTVTTGVVAPSTAPANEGDIYVDTNNDNIYIAKGTASSADWKLDVKDLNDLSDVSSSDPSNKYVLIGTGSNFVSRRLIASDLDAESSADGYVLTSDGLGNAAWEAATGGGGNVTKVGTPVDNQVGVWTGDGTIEGTSGLTYDGSSLGVTGNITVTGTVDGRDVAADGTTLDGNVDYLPRVLTTTAKTTGFTAVIGETHYIDTSAGGFTATLPAIASGQGRIAFYFTGTGNSLTVDPNAAETIIGKSSIKLDHGHNTIENDGTEWKLVQRSGISPSRLDPAQITANQDGYNPTDWGHGVTHLYIDSDASREIQGFEENGFHDMEQVIVTNDGSNDIIIKHDTSTTVANRVLVDGGADFTLGANQTGILMRDGTVNKWRFYGINQDLTSYQLKPAEGAFVDGDKTKLDGIETLADVTDSTNVVSALDSAVLTDAGTPAATDQVLIKDAGTGALQTADFSDFGGGSVATDTLWDAAGDLAIGTGADAATRLAIGTNGQVLTSNGTTAVWAAAGAADNLGNHTATQDLNMAGFNVDSADSIYLDEKAAADVDVVGDGQLWVKDSSPNRLMFTDDTGQDFELLETYMGFACSDETTALTTGQKIATDMPFDFTVTRVYASLVTAGTTTAITVDVEDEGVSILNAVLSISAGSNNAETSTFASAATEYALTKGDLLTVDVDSVDSGATGAGLKIYLVGYRT